MSGDWRVVGVVPGDQQASPPDLSRSPVGESPPAAAPADSWSVVRVEPPQVSQIKQAAAKAKARTPLDDVGGALASIYRGTGVLDEASGAFGGALRTGEDLATGRGFHPVKNFQKGMAVQRAAEDDFADAHPVAAGYARATGGLAPAAVSMFAPELTAARGLLGGVVPNGGRIMATLKGAGRGMAGALASGAAYAGLDRGDAGERLKAMGQAAVDPLSAAVGLVTGGIGGAVRSRRPPTPTVGQLRQTVRARYTDVDNMNAAYSPTATAELARGMTDDFSARTVSPVRHGAALDAYNSVTQRLTNGTPVTMSELDSMRQDIRDSVVRPAMRADNRSEAALGQHLLNHIDEFMDAAGPGQMTTVGAHLPGFTAPQPADAQRVALAMRSARAANMAYRKVEDVTNAMRHGTLTAAAANAGANIDNRSRQTLLPFLDPESPHQMKNLTPDEAAQLEQTVVGRRGQNLGRWAGRSSPESGGFATQVAAATALAHPPAAAIPVTGFIAKRFADSATRKNVEGLMRLMATGGNQAALDAGDRLRDAAARNPQVRQMMRWIARTTAFKDATDLSEANRKPQGVSVESIQDPKTGRYLYGGPPQ